MHQNNSFDYQKSDGYPLSLIMLRAHSLAIACLSLLSILLLSGCSPPANGSADSGHGDFKFTGQHPINVVCTTGMVADLAKNIGGKHVEVKALMGAGVDPHLYKASPGDLNHMSNADMVLYSGWHLEGKMTEVFENFARDKPTIPVAEVIPHEQILSVEGGAHDPHVWFDVSLWSQAAGAVRDALIAFDEANAADYKTNAAAYQERLAKLH